MRFIDKRVSVAPARVAEALREVRATRWNKWSGTRKKSVVAALVASQGHVCAYCESRLSMSAPPRDEAAYHADHVVPVSHVDGAGREFDWDNLVASCRREFDREDPRHCGHARGEWYDTTHFIHPLDVSCEVAYVFNDIGEISAAPGALSEAAHETIARLNLNVTRLVERRREALSAFVLSLFLDGAPSIDDYGMLRTSLDMMNKQGEYEPYRGSLAQALDRLIAGEEGPEGVE